MISNEIRLDHHTSRLVTLGVLAAFFFSSTFVLNRVMADAGGHWYWTASLRYVFVLILLTFGFVVRWGWSFLRDLILFWKAHWRLWCLAGGIGFGAFYCLLCFAASFTPGWVVATTWQSTIVATLLVLYVFGSSVDVRSIFISSVVFIGVIVVNSSLSQSLSEATWGVVPVLLAAVCYPVGNSICGFAKAGGHSRVPHLTSSFMDSPYCRVWLMTLGAMPLLVLVGCFFQPSAPQVGQVTRTLYVAVSTGIVATTIFFHARHSARTAQDTAAVDATQAAEVPFALAIEVFLFGGHWPNSTAVLGLLLVVGGLIAYPLRRRNGNR